MTAREAIHRLNERGWSNSQIAAAMGRGRGQIINISSGRAPGTVLQGPLEALTRRTAPPTGKLPPVARGAAKPPPKRTPGGRGLETVAERSTVGKGKEKHRVSEALPEVTGTTSLRRELLYYKGRRVRVTVQIEVTCPDEEPVISTVTLWGHGIKAETAREILQDDVDTKGAVVQQRYIRPECDMVILHWLIEEVR